MYGVWRIYLVIVTNLILFGCQSEDAVLIDRGVSKELAEFRIGQISNAEYFLTFNIPEGCELPITGELRLLAELSHPNSDLILDFDTNDGKISSITQNGQPLPFEIQYDHVVIDKKYIDSFVDITIQFLVSKDGLVCKNNYVYSLLVPDKASNCFPVFNQPTIKSKFHLNLEAPTNWTAVSNSSISDSREGKDGRAHFEFDETEPISPYMLFFGAGKLEEYAITGNRVKTIYFTDSTNSIDQVKAYKIADIHSECIQWLENYTEIDYPFSKMDLISLPDLYIGGMEHPGIVTYQSASVSGLNNNNLLEEISVVELVAHEMAHMWIGNYTTIEWYDEVWLKEGLAGFLAIKFLKSKYGIEQVNLYVLLNQIRTTLQFSNSRGANTVKPIVNNSNEAVQVYTKNLYNRTPLAFLDLEAIVGEQEFQRALKTYLNDYSYGNANWNDFKTILSSKEEEEIQFWFEKWMTSTSLPKIKLIGKLTDSLNSIPITDNLDQLNEPLQRAKVWITREQAFQQNEIDGVELFDACLQALAHESNIQLVSYLNELIKECYWLNLTQEDRTNYAPKLEALLINQLINNNNQELRGMYFYTFLSIATTDQSLQIMQNLWNNKIELNDSFSEMDDIHMALSILIRQENQDNDIYKIEKRRKYTYKNSAYFEFIYKALVKRGGVGYELFDTDCGLISPLWINDALNYQFHPANRRKSVNEIENILDFLINSNSNDLLILEDRINIVLKGYTTKEAYEVINNYMNKKNNLTPQVRSMILRSSDHLYRLYANNDLL